LAAFGKRRSGGLLQGRLLWNGRGRAHKMLAMRHGYPLMLDVQRRSAAIVGGGAVAVRKARGLIECGCGRIVVIAPQIRAEMPATAQRTERAYESGDLRGHDLAFAATDSARVNAQVVADAKALGILVSRADGEANGGAGAADDFASPARLARGELMVAVSAGSPALAAFIRDRLAEHFDPVWADLADATAAIRQELKADSSITSAQRQWLMRQLASNEAADVWRGGAIDALRAWAMELRKKAPAAVG
jgi:precorrin-2 dehydrogenase/sirohydrochlorin ferrochelatase